MVFWLVMKQYIIDGLRPNDYSELKKYLDANLEASPISSIYWLELPREILTPMQKEHKECKPHVFALVLENDYLSIELLVRIKKSIRCDCMGYALPEQREWLFNKVDMIFDRLGIRI